METRSKTIEELNAELEELQHQLFEANETIDAIRTGQIDAIVVQDQYGPQLYSLRSADQAYRVFIEKMTEGALTLNKVGIILYCNSQFAHLVGKPLSNVIGIPFVDLVVTKHKKSFQDLFQRSWTKDSRQEIALKAGKDSIVVQLSAAQLEFDDGKTMSMIVTDLTAQKKTQELLEDTNLQLARMNHALEMSNHDLQQFASVASHDLQEPVRKILIFSNLIKERCNEDIPKECGQYIDKIVGSAARMKTLIIDVLNYSKLSANQKEFHSVDLGAVVEELLEDFELIIKEKNAMVTVGNLPTIEVNKGQIRQVFQNIFSNALKFSKEGIAPVIQIKAKRLKEKSFSSSQEANGPFCLISIKDNGIGFDEKYRNQIFALFERLHSKDSYEGTGIGLAITKKIIEKHNGLVHAKSHPGGGAEFLLLLPIEQQNE